MIVSLFVVYASINWIFVTKTVFNASTTWRIKTRERKGKCTRMCWELGWTVVATKPIFKKIWDCTMFSTFLAVKWTSRQRTLCFHEMVLGNKRDPRKNAVKPENHIQSYACLWHHNFIFCLLFLFKTVVANLVPLFSSTDEKQLFQIKYYIRLYKKQIHSKQPLS